MNQVITREKSKLPIEYIGFLASYAPSTRKVYHSNFRGFFNYLNQAGYTLDTIDQNIINLYFNSIQELSNSAYNLKVSSIKNFLEHTGKHFKYNHRKIVKYSKTKTISPQSLKNIFDFLLEAMYLESPKQKKYYPKEN